jgi:HEAT repeat protein
MDVLPTSLPEPDAPRLRSRTLRMVHFVAMSVGVVFAFLVASGGGPVAGWGKTTGLFSAQQNSEVFSPALSEADLDRLRPQKQAEMLLERAVSGSGTADATEVQVEAQIEARLDAWRGKLQWDSQLGDLTTVALNSSDRRVRASAIEVQLAAYGLTKSESSIDVLLEQANARDHGKRIWALWALGLLGNRGVQPDRVVRALTAHLRDSRRDSGTNKNKNGDEDARRWAVEGLALVGTTPTIAPLLEAMHDDPSPLVRERAAGNLAESGMLTHQQRLIAVPQLINLSGDPSLDAQTHAWAFQALANITQQSLPHDSAAWRNWYQTSAARGQ